MATSSKDPARISIPTQKKAFPKEKQTDAMGLPNWADNDDTVAKFLARAKADLTEFNGQDQWEQFEEKMKLADQFVRMSPNITKQTENLTPNETDTRPEIFARNLRTINSNETEVLFNSPQPMARYIPRESGTSDALDATAEQVCRFQDALLNYSIEADNRKEKLRNAHNFINKYGNGVLSMEWLFQKKKVTRRLAVMMKTGLPKMARDGTISTHKVTTEEITEHPMLTSYDMKDVRFNALIDDFQKQRTILVKRRRVFGNLLDGQKNGMYKNVSKVGLAQLARNEGSSDVKTDRQKNAGEAGVTDSLLGHFNGRVIWMMAPINDKGEWDEAGTPEKYFWCEVVGDMEIQGFDPKEDAKTKKLKGLVCLKLSPNPYDDEEHPFQIVHSHRDDKGALHMGYIDYTDSLWHEFKTALDQWIQNKNLVNGAGWLTEKGAIHTDDKTFHPRKLTIMKEGAIDLLKRLKVDPNTNDLLPYISYLERRFKDAFAITDPFEGIAMGARTSASEARNAKEASMRPFIDKLRYMAEAEIIWMAVKDARLWRQFARPETKIQVTMDDGKAMVQPLLLHGPIACDVQIVEEYSRNILSAMELDRLLSVILPIIAQTEGKEAVSEVIKQVLDMRNLGLDTKKIFKQKPEVDAEHVAYSEDLGFMQGIPDDPKPGENDAAHLRTHRFDERMFNARQDTPAVAKQLIREHIIKHERAEEQGQVAMQQTVQEGVAGMPGPGPSDSPPTTEGEAAGDILGAEGGAAA